MHAPEAVALRAVCHSYPPLADCEHHAQAYRFFTSLSCVSVFLLSIEGPDFSRNCDLVMAQHPASSEAWGWRVSPGYSMTTAEALTKAACATPLTWTWMKSVGPKVTPVTVALACVGRRLPARHADIQQRAALHRS